MERERDTTLGHMVGPEYKKADLHLGRHDRRLAIEALRKMQDINGIGLAGPRAKELQTRFEARDTHVSLPEFNTLGFALSRLDTAAGYALLKKLTDLVSPAPQATSPVPRPALPISARPCGFCDGVRKLLHLPPIDTKG